MKNYVTDFDLTAAFKALDEIDYEKPEGGLTANRNILNESITDRKGRQTTQSRTLNVERLVEDYYDLSSDADLNQAAEDRDGDIAQAKLARIEKIVDLDAKTADDLLPSYVGKVIVQCPQCMNLFYKNEEDLVKDEEDPTTCNVNEPCQHCGNISGYTIIGKVDKLDAADQAELGGDIPADDLNLDAVPTEEGTEETSEETPAEEAPTEGGEDDLDLDLNLDLEEPAQESLNRANAAKSDFASENTSKFTTLNEEVDPELDKKLAAHDSYIDYLRGEIESLEAAIKNEKNEEIKAAKEAHLAELNQALDEALPDAVKNAPVDGIDVEASVEETQPEEAPVEETDVAPEADGADKVGLEDLPTKGVQESLNEGADGTAEEIDYYEKDIADALIELKKKGHAEFWCSQGKEKAEEVKKAAKEKYNLDVEYTINDDYCTAKVVKSKKESINESLEEDVLTELVNKIPANIRADLAVATDAAEGEDARDIVGDISFDFNFEEDTIAKATELVNAVLSNLDTSKYSYQIWNPGALSTEGCQSIDEVVKEATEQGETDLFDEDGYLNISIYHSATAPAQEGSQIEVLYTDGHTEIISEDEKDALVAELEDFTRTDVDMITRIDAEGELISTIWTEEEGVLESLNNSKAQKDAEEKSDLATDIKSEHKSLQEGSAAQMLAAFEASLDDDAPVAESVNKAEIDANTVPENASENKSINESIIPDITYDEAKKYFGKDYIGIESLGDKHIGIIYHDSRLGDDESENEQETEYAIDDEGHILNILDGTRLVNEACKDCGAKSKDNLAEAVAITIGVEEVKDTVTPTADTMIIAEPETDTTAVYTPDDTEPQISIEAQPVEVEESPFGQEFDAEYDDEPEVDPFDQEFDEYEEEPEDDDDDDDDDDDNNNESGSEPEADNAEDDEDDDDDDKKDESLKESLQEGIWDKVKAAGSAIGAAAKNVVVGKGDILNKYFTKGYTVVATDADGKTSENKMTDYNQAEKYANGQSTQPNIKQVIIKGATDNNELNINGFINGKQANKGKELFANAVKAAQGAEKMGAAKPSDTNQSDLDVTAPAPQAQPVQPVQGIDQSVVDQIIAAASKKYPRNGKTFATMLKNIVASTTQATESLNEDIESAAEDTLAELDELNKQSEKIMADAVSEPVKTETETETETEIDANEGLASAVGDVVNGVANGVKDLLADNADDAKDATGAETIDDKYQSTGFGDETPNTEASDTEEGTVEVEETVEKPLDNNNETSENTTNSAVESTDENLQEDVSDAEFDQMIHSDVFQDFNEKINPDELEDIDEESVNECTTNYLKEVYSNVDKFELTRGDVKNNVLVLEGVIKFHSGAERTTTFGYNLNNGLNLKGVNEDLAKGGEFVMSCTLENKKLIAESLSYKYEVNGQLIEGLIRR